MKTFHLNRSRVRFFTLTELLIVVTIVLLLSTLAIPVIKSSRAKAYMASCMGNLRKIALGCSNYRVVFKQYPPQPFRNQNLLVENLKDFVDTPEIFHCPVDEPNQKDSYSNYFVKRSSQDSGDAFLVGCPRHNNGTLAVNVFYKGNATTNPIGDTFRAQGTNIDAVFPGDTIGTGTTYFPDGSSATITSATFKAEIIESFRLQNGQTYTMIKIPPDEYPDDLWGTLILNVTPGSIFEVITPTAIAGVRGTVFMVEIEKRPDGEPEVDIFVYEGAVAVSERTGLGEKIARPGIPIQCLKGKAPYISPDPVPPLPGIPASAKDIVRIDRSNPPWVMGPSPWRGSPPPWVPAYGLNKDEGPDGANAAEYWAYNPSTRRHARNASSSSDPGSSSDNSRQANHDDSNNTSQPRDEVHANGHSGQSTRSEDERGDENNRSTDEPGNADSDEHGSSNHEDYGSAGNSDHENNENAESESDREQNNENEDEDDEVFDLAQLENVADIDQIRRLTDEQKMRIKRARAKYGRQWFVAWLVQYLYSILGG